LPELILSLLKQIALIAVMNT